MLKLLNNFLKKTLLHTDTFKDSLISDNLFIIAILGLVLFLLFLIYKYLKK
tara:strand:+ start:399 stop:551 length:153 start_codon:yes stop_codon:yes gene_type:complete